MATYAQILMSLDIEREKEFYDALKGLWETMTGNEARRGEDAVEMALYILRHLGSAIDMLERETWVNEEGSLVQKV
jgi:hypothetical protein